MKSFIVVMLSALTINAYADGVAQKPISPVPARVAVATAKNALKLCANRYESIGVSSNRSYLEHRFQGCHGGFSSLRVIRVYGADQQGRDDEWFLLVDDDTNIQIEDN